MADGKAADALTAEFDEIFIVFKMTLPPGGPTNRDILALIDRQKASV